MVIIHICYRPFGKFCCKDTTNNLIVQKFCSECREVLRTPSEIKPKYYFHDLKIYFQALKIINHVVKIYFQALKIINRGVEIRMRGESGGQWGRYSYVGIDPKDTGEVFLEGKKLDIKSPADAIENGLAMVTEDRRGSGIIVEYAAS